MNKGNIITALDIGTSKVRSVVAQKIENEERLRIIGVGEAISSGLRKGVISDVGEVTKAIEDSISLAQRMSAVESRDVVVSVGGSDISFQSSKGVIAVGRADGEVTEDDVSRIINEAQTIPLPLNREILHVVPKKYRLDDQEDLKDPVGMKGVRLELEALIIESGSMQIKNLTKSLYQAGLDVDDMVLEPLAAAEAVLTKKQKELGVILINLGAGTTSMAVYEEGELLHTAIAPVGAGHVTNDIAIGLRTSVDNAEKIKLEYGNALSAEVDKKEGIDISKIDSQEEGIVSAFHVAEIIEARLEEIFELVQKELKNIGKAGLLPAGAVLVGGGAKTPHIVELAKKILGLPVQIGFPEGFGGLVDKVYDPSFCTALGLLKWSERKKEVLVVPEKNFGSLRKLSLDKMEGVEKVKDWMKRFLP